MSIIAIVRCCAAKKQYSWAVGTDGNQSRAVIGRRNSAVSMQDQALESREMDAAAVFTCSPDSPFVIRTKARNSTLSLNLKAFDAGSSRRNRMKFQA